MVSVCQKPFRDDRLRAGAANDLRVPLCGIDAGDLRGIHLQDGAFLEISHRLRIQNVLALAVALAVMLFRVPHTGTLPDIEGVYPVVAVFRTAVMDAAAGDDGHVAVLSDVKIVVNCLV